MNKTIDYIKENIHKLIGLWITLVLPFAVFIFPKDTPKMFTELYFWTLFCITIYWIRKKEKREFASIGINFSISKRALIVNTVILFFLLAVGLIIFQQFWNFVSLTVLVREIEIPKILLFIRAGIVEEVLFRGYAMTRLHELTQKPLISLFAISFVFSLLHIKAGVHGLLISFVLGLILGTFFHIKKDLSANILAHFLIDLLFAS